MVKISSSCQNLWELKDHKKLHITEVSGALCWWESEKEEFGPNYILLELKEIKYPKVWCLDPNGLGI